MFYSTTKLLPPGILLIMIFFITTAQAQKPEIVAVDKLDGSMGEVVTLKGSSFGTDDTDLAVFFGAARAPIQSVTNQLLEVIVPPGATHDNISVANISNGLTGYSRNQFLLSYGGTHPFNISNLGTQLDFNAGNELYDHCLCDFNNDGMVDIATANKSSTSISILQNTSTGVGNINFLTTQLSIGAVSLQIKCGDLNGDGRPDLVVTEGTTGINDRVFILQNNGGFAFSQQSIKLTGRKNSKIEIADLDLNGKPEVIITDQGSNSVSILINQSVGPIAFAPAPLVLTIPDAATTDGIGVKDLNGDDLPDIVTSQFGTANSNLYIVPNTSVLGTISFGAVSKITIGGSIRDIRLADFDNDRKQDIAAAQFLTGKVSLLLNTSSLSAISFGAATEFSVEAGPWGLDAGDVDGDGKADIVVASIATTNLTILNNASTPGNLVFARHTAVAQFITRHVRVGDLDGDGKPDISFSSVDKSGVPASKVSVFRNESCVTPTLSPATSPLALCGGALPYTLTATLSRGSFYQWLKDGVQIACGLNQNTFAVTAGTGTGTYTVKVIGEGGNCTTAGACAVESEGIDVVIGGATSVMVNPTNNGPVCIGSPLNLSVGNDLGNSYRWTGPAGFTSTIKNPTIANFQLVNAGTYTVEVTVGTCIASIETTVVEAIDAPVFQVDAGASTVMCQGDPVKILSVANAPGFSYQWLKNGTPIGGAMTNTFTVTSVPASSGAYAVTASYAGCATITTPSVDIRVAALPTAAFTAPPSACAGQKVNFTNQSTGDASVDLFYTWDFEDGPVSATENPEHIFAVPGTYDVLLTVSYKDGMCSQNATHPVTITAAPPVAITNADNDYSICDGESITLEVIGAFTSYAWSTGATGSSITASDDGTYSVDVTATNGCVLTATRNITGLPAPGVVVTATPQQINEGETTQLSATGLENFQWTPVESLTTAPNIADPVANPPVTTTYTVTGTDVNGCTGVATIQVTVLGEAIVNKLGPKNFFSPNNDGPNELWQVDNIADYPQCGVTIYDDKGVKVYSAKPYNNDWNGTFNGKVLPDGVYFFVIRCDGEENAPRTGSITVIR